MILRIKSGNERGSLHLRGHLGEAREEAIRYCDVLALISLKSTSSTAAHFLGKHVIQTGENLLEKDDSSKDDCLISVR